MKLSDKAYVQIKEMIKERKYRPGDPLTETELCNLLTMSRTPIRQALKKLEEEQIVRIKPRHGAYVATLDLKELCNIYESREAIEGMMVALNCRREIRLDEYIDLKTSLEKLISQPESVEKYKGLDDTSIKLMALIKKNCENPILERMLNIITEQIDTLAYITRTIPKFPDESAPEHLRIIEAIINKDRKNAENVARQHVRNTFKRILNSM